MINVHEFKARPTQYEALDKVLTGIDKYELFCGGVGSGKTATGSHFALDRITSNPETVGFIGANTYTQLDQSTLKAFFSFLEIYNIDYVFNINPERKYGYKSKFKKHNGIISFPSGCQVITRSLDNYDDIRGVEIGWFWIDETRDTKKEAWDVIKARLRDKNSKLLCGFITTTPNGYDWIYAEFEEKPKIIKDGKQLNIGHGYVTCSARENEKNLPANFIDELESSYDELIAEQEIEGKFINTKTGRVYYSFVNEKYPVGNICQFDYKKELVIDLCLDFNVDPMKWGLVQIYNGKDYLFDEIVKHNTNTPAMANEVKQRYGVYPDVEYYVYGDYSGTFRDTRSRTNDYELLKEILQIPESNIRVKPNPSVDSRVTSFNARLCNSKGERNFLIDSKCEHAIKDLNNVVYDKNGKIEKVTNDLIKKQLTHISDAIGYREEYLYNPKGQPTVKLGYAH